MTPADVLEAERVEDLAEAVEPLAIVAIGFAEHGRPALLATAKDSSSIPFGRTGGPSEPSFPRVTTERPWPATANLMGDAVDLGDLSVAFPFVQPLPNGELLIVGGRCRPGDENASVVAANGARRLSFCAGDGIESVQTTRSGDIWVSYFDEGVFGNFGWGGGRGPAPIGSPGLVRFATDGSISYRFSPPSGHDSIADCYALNVGEDHVWAYYYTDFDLVRIDHAGSTRAWSTDIAGARAVAIHGDRVLFFGGYGDDRNAAQLGRLDRSDVDDLRTLAICDSAGRRIAPDLAVGRGRCLHLLAGSTWWRVDLATLPDR